MSEILAQRENRDASDRPFPWRCAKCLQRTVQQVRAPYRASAAHDGCLYEFEIPEALIPQCSACGERVFSNRVDEQITEALRKHLRLLTPEQIQQARSRLGLDRKALAERLGAAEETLERWEEGTLIQPRTMDNLLRVFFALPEVRSALTGAGQDPALGLELTLQGT